VEKKTEFHLWYFVIAFAAILILQAWWQESQTVETIPYSAFQELVESGRVTDLKVGPARITGMFSEPEDGKTRFVTTRVDPALAEELAGSGVTFTGTSDRSLVRDILSWIIPIGLFFAIWMFMFRRIADRQGFGGLTTIGKSNAKVYVEKDTSVTFEDVAGVDEAKGELQEIVSFLRAPDSYGRLGARIPKGILLPAWDRQDLAGPRGRRRGKRAVLFHQWVRIHRDVRRRRRGAGARLVRKSPAGGTGDYLHRRT
jgi:cell division protease FtsH